MERFARVFPDRAQGLSATDLAAAVPGEPPADRPFVLANMIATADGRATIAGRTATIANRADYELFHALRARVDAIMVGAETVRVESYGRMIVSEEARAAREREGMSGDAMAVLVTRSAAVPATVGMLRAPENHVVVLTPSPDATLPPAQAQVSYLRAPVVEGVRRLRSELGVRSLLCEGGPQLLGDLVRAGLVDELHLVLAPKVAGGHAPLTIISGDDVEPPSDLRLLSVHESGGYLFLRYGF